MAATRRRLLPSAGEIDNIGAQKQNSKTIYRTFNHSGNRNKRRNASLCRKYSKNKVVTYQKKKCCL